MASPIPASASTEAATAPVAAAPRRRRGGLARRLSRDPIAAGSAIFLVLIALSALLAPWLAPHDPYAIIDRPLAPAGGATALGTDDVGRDILSRLLYASRVSLAVGIGAAVLTVMIGTLIGALAGFYGGRVDLVLSGLVNLMLSIPTLPLALVISAFVEIDLPLLILVIGGVSWTGVSRIVRAEVLSLRERQFIESARAIGCGDSRIVWRHIVPGTIASLAVVWSFDLARVVVLEASLSFLGLGVQPPTPSWGMDLSESRQFLQIAYWTVLFPGLAISLVVLAANLAGDWVRDVLDPVVRRTPRGAGAKGVSS